MAVSLNFENCARRFLSPTRSCKSQNRDISSVGKRMNLQIQTFKSTTHNQRNNSKQAYVPPKLQGVFSSTKNAIQEWTGKTVSEINAFSATRIVSVMNIDIPKVSFLARKKVLPTKGKKVDFENGNSSCNHYEDSNVESLRPKSNGVQKDTAVDKPSQLNNLDKAPNNSSVLREQHDFYQAMADNYESVQSFYESVDMPQDNLESDGNPKVSPQTGLRKSIINKLGTNFTFLPNQNLKKESPVKVKKILPEKQKPVSKATIDKHTRQLAVSVKRATELTSKLIRLEDLCAYIIKYPEGRNVVYQVWTLW